MSAAGFAAVVLAAGAGTRFGEPKAVALLRPDVRFVDAVVEAALAAGASPVLVVGAPGLAVPAGARLVPNPHALGEQIASLRLGLARLANTAAAGALAWPVDHPFVRAETARALAERALAAGAPVALPVHAGRRGHPAWFARATWRELMTVAEGGARAVVRAYGAAVLEVPVDDAGVLRDVDTRADLACGLEAEER